MVKVVGQHLCLIFENECGVHLSLVLCGQQDMGLVMKGVVATEDIPHLKLKSREISTHNNRKCDLDKR